MQPFQEWVVQLAKIFSDFSVGGAAVVAAVLGVKGFTAWRKELVGKARYDAVRSVMKKAFEYQRAFNEARVDPDLPGYRSGRVHQDDEPREISRILDLEHDTRPTIDALRRVSLELQECCWEAEVLLGEIPGEWYMDFGKLTKELSEAWLRYYKYSYFVLLEKTEPTNIPEPVIVSVEKDAGVAQKIIYGADGDEMWIRAHSAVVILRNRVNKHLQA